MSIAHIYQEFGGDKLVFGTVISQENRDIDAEKLQAFEDGYQAGWKDSNSSALESREAISASIAKNLQEMSFGYHEARRKLLDSISPLFEIIFSKLLPEVSRATIGPIIVEDVTKLVRDQLDQRIEICVSKIDFEAVNSFLEEQIREPFTLSTETTLAEGQVFLRLGGQEREINFAKLISKIQNRTFSLFELEPENG